MFSGLELGLERAQCGPQRQGKHGRHQRIALFSTFGLKDAVGAIARSPHIAGLPCVPHACKGKDRLNGRCIAQCSKHGLPTDDVVGGRSVDGQHRQGGIGLGPGLQGVDQRLSAGSRGEGMLVWVAQILELCRKLLRNGPGHESSKRVTNDQPSRPSTRLADGDEAPQGEACNCRLWHLCVCKDGSNFTEQLRCLFLIQDQAKNFRGVATGTRCSTPARSSKIREQCRAVEGNRGIRSGIKEVLRERAVRLRWPA